MMPDEAARAAEDEAVEAVDGAEINDTDDAELLAHSPATPTRAHRIIPDALYGALPISRWAQALLELAPFERLAGVSLSDVPGELLFHAPFPSRLTHSLGVYYLARQARPRDRALHAAALAHDLGHGPFSHLTEPLMIERLGIGHEQRGALLLRQALAQTSGVSARLLAWLDPDEVTALMLGESADGRGKLLNGLMDYDNLDNVARFLQAAGLGDPGYDPRTLARELRLVVSDAPPGADQPPAAPREPFVALAPGAATQAQAWLADRRRVYRFLAESPRNHPIHGMLRKAVDLAAQAGMLGAGFFDATDAQALQLLRAGVSPGAALLADAVTHDALYARIWEANAPEQNGALAALFAQGQARLEIEERVATEAGLLPHEVVLSYTVARGERALPPILTTPRGRAEPAPSLPAASAPALAIPARSITLLITPTAGRDYVRRARMAAERALGALGATPRA